MECVQNALCIIFYSGTDFAEDLLETMYIIEEMDPKNALLPGTDEFNTNMMYTIYAQMRAAVLEDPKSFAEHLELSHLDSENSTVVISSMHALQHFGPLLYGSATAMTRALTKRREQLMDMDGMRMN